MSRLLCCVLCVLFVFCNAASALIHQHEEGQTTSHECPSTIMTKIDKEARAGDKNAQFHLGVFLVSGICKNQDVNQGIRFLELAALNEHVEAAVFLGDLYLEGEFVPENVSVSSRYFLIAAEKGHVEAQHKVGLQLLIQARSELQRHDGLGWLGRAVSQGDSLSAVVLGMIHHHGMHGVTKDICLALDWYEVAEDMGLKGRFDAYTILKTEHGPNCF